MKEEECLEFFDKLWILENNRPTYSVRTNFSSFSDYLLDWSKVKFGNLPLRIKQIRQQLDIIRSQSSWYVAEEEKLELELNKLMFSLNK